MKKLLFSKNITSSRLYTSCPKPFKEIPGPKQIPLIGNVLLFSPFGPYKINRLVEAHQDLHRKYGPVVNIRLGIPMILLFDPDDICIMYRNEGKLPKRLLFDALNEYRKENKDKYLHMGIVSNNGEDWQLLRQHVSWLLRPSVPIAYLSALEKVADDFADSVSQKVDDRGYITNFLSELYSFTQESIGIICFGTRLGCLSKSGNITVATAVDSSLEAMADITLGLPWWKFWKTPSYKKLEKSQNFLWKIAMQHLQNNKIKNLEEPSHIKSNPFLHHILNAKDLDYRDALLIVSEIFQGGIDAT